MLLGANGAGKSTLMRVMVGVLPPSHGEVRRSGSSGLSPGYLPQDFTAPRMARVDDYLAFVAWCRSSRRARVSGQDVAQALAAVDLTARAGYRSGALSGGMRRRLGVAQAILGGPDVVVLDEPTVGLDPVQRAELRELVVELGRQRTVVVSTHLAEDVAAIADRVLILADGAQVFDGTVGDLAARGGASTVSSEAVEKGFLAVVRQEAAA